MSTSQAVQILGENIKIGQGFGAVELAAAILLNAKKVAAAGNSLATGTTLASGLSMVTGADGTKCVTLPATPTVGELFIVWNTDESSTLEVYPGSGDSINAASAEAPFTVAAMGCIILVAFSAGQYYAVEPAVAAV